MKRFVSLPAVRSGKRITLASYTASVKYAKAHPRAEFRHGFTCWWPVSGAVLVEQFWDGVVERINSGAPRCLSWGGR